MEWNPAKMMVCMPGDSGPTRPSFCWQWQDRSLAWVMFGGSPTSATRTEEVRTADVTVALSLFSSSQTLGSSYFHLVSWMNVGPILKCIVCRMSECEISHSDILQVDCKKWARFKYNLLCVCIGWR